MKLKATKDLDKARYVFIQANRFFNRGCQVQEGGCIRSNGIMLISFLCMVKHILWMMKGKKMNLFLRCVVFDSICESSKLQSFINLQCRERVLI